MARWLSKEPERPVEVIERIEPVEIPIITETKRRLARGEYAPALQGAYDQVLLDLQRAYGQRFPPGWTNGEILDRGSAESWGHLPDFLRRLTDLYMPFRFGGQAPSGDPETLLGLLQSIYAARPMWRLYVEPRQERPTSVGADAPSATGPPATARGSEGAA